MILAESQRAFLWAVAQVLVPKTQSLSPERRARFFEIIEEMLSTRPRSVVRLIALFLVFMRWSSVLRFGGRLDKLAPEKQRAALEALECSRVPAIRSGFWGVKTIVFMGYFAQPEVAQTLGYTPTFSGNEKLHHG